MTRLSDVLPPIGQKVLLVGGPYDGCIAEFSHSRYVAMHDPDGSRPDALYAWDLDFFSEIGKIKVSSGTWVPDAEVPPRPLEQSK